MTKTNKVIAGLGVAAVLGVSFMPLAGIASATTVTVDPATQNVTVKYTINGNLALSLDGDKATTISNLSAAETTLSSTATVTGNSSYTLSLKGATTDLRNGHGGSIAAISTPAATLAAGQWGYKLTSIPSGATSAIYDAGNFNDVTTTGTTIVSHDLTAEIPTAGEATVINYGAFANANQPAGAYSDALTYTLAAVVAD